MFSKSLGRLEKHAFFVLFMAFILIMLWHAIWGVADYIEEYIQEQYRIKKVNINIITLLIIILIIGIYPKILEKL